MLAGGMVMSYKNLSEYTRTLKNLRNQLCVIDPRFYVPRGRRDNQRRLFQIAIFDEKGRSEIDLVISNWDLYILGFRAAEQINWLVGKGTHEFNGISTVEYLDFKISYPELGITAGDLQPFAIEHCSKHVAALKNFLTVGAAQATEPEKKACKTAIAYFAMTIAEAARLNEMASQMERGGIIPGTALEAVRRWVVESSVRDEQFPKKICVVGVHENQKGIWDDVWKDLQTKSLDKIPMIDELAGNDPDEKKMIWSLFRTQDKFKVDPAKVATLGQKNQFTQDDLDNAAIQFLIGAYFYNRVNPHALSTARKELAKTLKKKQGNKFLTDGDLKNLHALIYKLK